MCIKAVCSSNGPLRKCSTASEATYSDPCLVQRHRPSSASSNQQYFSIWCPWCFLRSATVQDSKTVNHQAAAEQTTSQRSVRKKPIVTSYCAKCNPCVRAPPSLRDPSPYKRVSTLCLKGAPKIFRIIRSRRDQQRERKFHTSRYTRTPIHTHSHKAISLCLCVRERRPFCIATVVVSSFPTAQFT